MILNKNYIIEGVLFTKGSKIIFEDEDHAEDKIVNPTFKSAKKEDPIEIGDEINMSLF